MEFIKIQICKLFGAHLLDGELACVTICFLLLVSSNLNPARKSQNALLLSRKRKWPTIILELGYGESDNELITSTDILLGDSKGRIEFVIVVKIECLAAGDQEIEEGYVELHKYNKDTGKRDQIGERQVISPPNYCLPISVANSCSTTILTLIQPSYAMHQLQLE